MEISESKIHSKSSELLKLPTFERVKSLKDFWLKSIEIKIYWSLIIFILRNCGVKSQILWSIKSDLGGGW